MNIPLVLAALLALTAPLAAGGEALRPSSVAAPPAAAVPGDGVVREVSDPADGPDVRLAEVDLAVPALSEVTPTDAAEAAGPEGGAVPGAESPTDGQAVPGTAEAPLDPAPTEVPLEPVPGTVVVADEPGGPGLVETAPVDTAGYQTIGITWPADADAAHLDARVRTSTAGEWGPWVPLAVGDDAPDAGTADAAAQVRGGTDPLWIGAADAVQLAFAATEAGGPDGMSLALVGSDLDDAPAGVAVAAVGAASTSDAAFVTAAVSTAATAPPKIVTRAQWGAPAQICRPDVASKLVGAVVHHTAGSNSYATMAQAMQQLRNDASYHIKGRGWCDLGYNFVVDKWGNIYEGRADSLTRPVIGVHAGGFNTGTVGVSMLGTYNSTPSPATQAAVASIIGWRLGAYGVDPRGSMTYWTGAGENSRYRNQSVSLPRVFAHRDVSFTACPGAGGTAAMPAIRSMAAELSSAQRFAQAEPVVTALYHDLLGRAPDPVGLSTWSTNLVSGTDQAELVGVLTRSDEYISLRVEDAYRTVLGRAPEAAGAADWLERIRAGHATVDDVQRRFFDSGEFGHRSGGTAEAYVAAVYQAALGRPITPAERDARVEKMLVHGRSWFVDDVWFSTEAASLRAGEYYRVFLKREPDVAGRAHWAQVLLTRSEGAVRTGIAGSGEYGQRALARYP